VADLRKASRRRARGAQVAREEGVSFSKVWRLAERECIDLAAGREAKGYKRLPAERRAAIIAARRARPTATQAEIARVTGVSRPTVTRIEGGRGRKLAAAKAEWDLRNLDLLQWWTRTAALLSMSKVGQGQI
jgi:DNA-binding XRE family transcriptional regulator